MQNVEYLWNKKIKPTTYCIKSTADCQVNLPSEVKYEKWKYEIERWWTRKIKTLCTYLKFGISPTSAKLPLCSANASFHLVCFFSFCDENVGVDGWRLTKDVVRFSKPNQQQQNTFPYCCMSHIWNTNSADKIMKEVFHLLVLFQDTTAFAGNAECQLHCPDKITVWPGTATRMTAKNETSPTRFISLFLCYLLQLWFQVDSLILWIGLFWFWIVSVSVIIHIRIPISLAPGERT